MTIQEKEDEKMFCKFISDLIFMHNLVNLGVSITDTEVFNKKGKTRWG
jgi:hypothetical protein